MFTNKDVLHYSFLLQVLNDENDELLPTEYQLIMTKGGKDGIPHYRLLYNTTTNTYLIWVRGTDFADPNDILINLRTKPIEFYGGCCHNGYFLSANEIIFQTIEYLDDEKVNKIVCIGHSLGGAVCSIIVMILNFFDFKNLKKLRGNNRINGLIFGTPPTFSLDICKVSRKFITNVVLKKDIVPKLGGLFNSLHHFQIQKVTDFFRKLGALKNDRSVGDRSGNEKYFRADFLPGNVVVIDHESENVVIQNGSNHSMINNLCDVVGVFHHSYAKYFAAIQWNVPENDDLFHFNDIQMSENNIEDVLKKKKSNLKKNSSGNFYLFDFKLATFVPKEKPIEIKKENYKFNFVFDDQVKK